MVRFKTIPSTMNKAIRHELKMLKYKKRLKNYRLEESDYTHAFRSHGKPCSCWVCRDEKFKRKIKHKNIEQV